MKIQVIPTNYWKPPIKPHVYPFRPDPGPSACGRGEGAAAHFVDRLHEVMATGDTLEPPRGLAPSEDQVRRMLEKQGYSDIRDLKRAGDSYTRAYHEGWRGVQLRVDPQRGRVDEIGG